MLRHLLIFVWNRKGKNALLMIELTFAFLILFGVYSFIKYNFDRYNTPLGFETENRMMVEFDLPYQIDSATVANVKEDLKRSIRSLNDVKSTTFSFNITPFSGSNWVSSTSDNGYEMQSNLIMADEDYADVMGINVIEGRWVKKEDQYEKYPSILVSKQLRDEVWPDTTVLGKVITWNGGEKQIVGVLENYKYLGEFEDETNIIVEYFGHSEADGVAMFIELNPGTSSAIDEKLNNIIEDIAKGWQFKVRNLDSVRLNKSKDNWVPIFGFLGISLFLVMNVALGLFGVLLYNIKKRKAEIGLRRAIGASAQNVFVQLIVEMLLITTLALVIGIFFAVQVPLLSFFDVAIEVYVYAGIWALLTIVLLVLICTLYPGSQAIIVQPAIALHEE